MTSDQIKKKILKYHWEPWLRRPFYGFMMSTFARGNSKRAFAKIGLKGWDYQSFLFSDGEWFQAEEVYKKSKVPILAWLKKHRVAEISSRLENNHQQWKKEIAAMAKNPQAQTMRKLERLAEILREITTYVWAVHALEHHFTPLLQAKTKKYIKGDAEKFIGDASFPEKMNASEQLIYEYRQGSSIALLTKKFSWMRARDGFSDPYTQVEIKDIIEHALDQSVHKRPNIPPELERIFADAQELVYLRMLRMDIYYELMYLAKPLLKILTKKFKIPFQELKYYTTDSLLADKPKKYPADYSCLGYNEEVFYFETSMFGASGRGGSNPPELKGTVAQKGIVKGTVKIVLSVADMPKVKKGDILVTYMTSPNFLPAMKLAAAFVTNEGGLTCHAAIVAREMGKPCIIGAKIATKVFKDGDVIEVDANKGIVKKII